MKDQPKLKKTDQQRVETFAKEYDSLCKEHGLQIIVNPAFKARDDSTFSIVLQHSIGKLPKIDNK